MHHLLARSVIISLIIILLGIVAIIQINNDFTSNVRIETGVSDTIKIMNSLGILVAAFIIACLYLLARSLPKKRTVKKKRTTNRKASRRKR